MEGVAGGFDFLCIPCQLASCGPLRNSHSPSWVPVLVNCIMRADFVAHAEKSRGETQARGDTGGGRVGIKGRVSGV